MAESAQWEPSRRARRRALQALYQWQLTGQSAHEITTQFLAAQDFNGVDQELFKRLLSGVIHSEEALVADLQPLLDRPFKDCDVIERIVLMMGAWQLRNAPELPWQVVLSESVELANHFGSAQSHAYVNAVLERAARAWNEVAQRPGSPPG